MAIDKDLDKLMGQALDVGSLRAVVIGIYHMLSTSDFISQKDMIKIRKSVRELTPVYRKMLKKRIKGKKNDAY